MVIVAVVVERQFHCVRMVINYSFVKILDFKIICSHLLKTDSYEKTNADLKSFCLFRLFFFLVHNLLTVYPSLSYREKRVALLEKTHCRKSQKSTQWRKLSIPK